MTMQTSKGCPSHTRASIYKEIVVELMLQVVLGMVMTTTMIMLLLREWCAWLVGTRARSAARACRENHANAVETLGMGGGVCEEADEGTTKTRV
jgi:hypothetical protein